jgi:hypothetical protein
MAGRPEKILADDIRVEKNWGGYRTSNATRVREAEKIVLNDEAARMAVRLSNHKPLDILKMLDCALPPSTLTWIEWPSYSQLDERIEETRRRGDVSRLEHMLGNREEREAWSRCGILVESKEDRYTITCIEHGRTKNELFEWPVTYEFVNTSEETLPVSPCARKYLVEDGRMMPVLKRTAMLWGYGTAYPGLANLNNKADLVIQPHIETLYGSKLMDGFVVMSLNEMLGMTRLAVGVLAMLNTSTETEQVVPKGRFLGGGKSHPYAPHRIATLDIPDRIQKRTSYVERRIRDESDRIRKRLHKVRAHFRHSRDLPINGEGWVRCTCRGREQGEWWHKRIAEHMRGDEELGTVERDYTLVRG